MAPRGPGRIIDRMIFVTALVLSVCSMPAAPGSGVGDGPAATRVYVYAARAPSGIVTEEEQGRLDSVRDLRDAIGRKSTIALVSDASEAQVVVEVLGREKRDMPVGGFGGAAVTPSGEMIVRLRVKFGEAQAEIKGVAQAYWGRAAKDAAERLLKWIARVAARPGNGPRPCCSWLRPTLRTELSRPR